MTGVMGPGSSPGRRRVLLPFQPAHYLVELFEVAVADLDGAAGVAVADGYGETERVADAFLKRDRVGIFCLAATTCPRLLRLAFRDAFLMRQRLGLADVEAFLDNALRRGKRIGHADQCAGVACRYLAFGDKFLHFRRQ